MPGKKGKIHSEAQRKFFGLVASGKKKVKGLSKREASADLKAAKGKKLPKRIGKKK